jgi:UDPglucose--hexose-1-phosphate uridylyltransferase
MAELRQDPISGRWVIIAPDRAHRPNASARLLGFAPQADNPFAVGREAETPGELLALREPGTQPDQPGWRVRVFPNKYPAATFDTVGAPTSDPLAFGQPAVGPHEVIVESARFVTCLSELTPAEVAEVVWVYRERLRWHRAHQTCACAVVFKNKGPAAGATLAHAHAQLLGTPWIPPDLAAELDGCERYHDQTGRELFADVLAHELQVTDRIVAATEHHVVLCPYASRVSGETWIVPRTPGAMFEAIDEDAVTSFAETLHHTLSAWQRAHPDLPYNYAIHSEPYGRSAPTYRWHLELYPRLGNVGGYEWGTGSYVNALPPETAAARLRELW